MAELQGIFCHPFLPSVLIIEGVGGMGSGAGWGGTGWRGWGGVRGGKNSYLGCPMDSHDTHTVANNTPVSHIASRRKYRSPLSNWRPPWVPLFQL